MPGQEITEPKSWPAEVEKTLRSQYQPFQCVEPSQNLLSYDETLAGTQKHLCMNPA